MSNDTKHTPGPWESFGAAVHAENGREIIFGQHNTRSGSAEERDANAELIAAAPEMYEALGYARRLLESYDPLGAAEYSVLENIRAALAKAEGR
jgi:hypothetical protein